MALRDLASRGDTTQWSRQRDPVQRDATLHAEMETVGPPALGVVVFVKLCLVASGHDGEGCNNGVEGQAQRQRYTCKRCG